MRVEVLTYNDKKVTIGSFELTKNLCDDAYKISIPKESTILFKITTRSCFAYDIKRYKDDYGTYYFIDDFSEYPTLIFISKYDELKDNIVVKLVNNSSISVRSIIYNRYVLLKFFLELTDDTEFSFNHKEYFKEDLSEVYRILRKPEAHY